MDLEVARRDSQIIILSIIQPDKCTDEVIFHQPPLHTSRRITPCILIWSHHPSWNSFVKLFTCHFPTTFSLFAAHPLHVTRNCFAMKNYITSQHVGWRGRRKCLYPVKSPEEWCVDCKVSVFIIMLFRESWRQPRPGDDNRILPLPLLFLSARSQSSSSSLSTVPGTVTSHTGNIRRDRYPPPPGDMQTV